MTFETNVEDLVIYKLSTFHLLWEVLVFLTFLVFRFGCIIYF